MNIFLNITFSQHIFRKSVVFDSSIYLLQTERKNNPFLLLLGTFSPTASGNSRKKYNISIFFLVLPTVTGDKAQHE